MKLSKQQLAYFETFGFLCFPGLLADQIDEITRRFENVWATYGGGHAGSEHDGEQRSALLPFIDRDKYLSAMLDAPRIDGIVSSILGDEYNYEASDGNFYVGNTEWHSDGYGRSKYLSIKMAMYLDPVGSDSGCLRIIPGSHFVDSSYGDALQKSAPTSKEQHQEKLWGIPGSDVPAFALESQPGDLVVFNHNLKHASFGGGERRRMFTLNFQQRYRDKDLPDRKDDIGSLARFWAERAYGKKMIETAGPLRMKHLEQRLKNDDHLPELVIQARQEMNEPSRG